MSSPVVNEGAVPLRVGLVVCSTQVSKYVLDLAQWGQGNQSVRVSHLVVHEEASGCGATQAASGKLAQWALRLLAALENVRLRQERLHVDHLSIHDASKSVAKVIRVRPVKSNEGYRYPPDAIDQIREAGIDVLIWCGKGELQGAILQATRLGVIALAPVPLDCVQGDSAGFAEVLSEQPASAFTIRRLVDGDAGAETLRQGRFPTQRYYLLNQAALVYKSLQHLKRLLVEWSVDSRRAGRKVMPMHDGISRDAGLPDQLRYGAKTVRQLAMSMLRRLQPKQRDRWSVAFAHMPWHELDNDAMGRAPVVKNPAQGFIADPFLITEGGKTYLFVEELDFSVRRGFISVYQINKNTVEFLGKALEEPFHLSFPFLFRHSGKIYMCPETGATRQIRIYEPVAFPLKWKLCKVAMDGVDAADTMIFKHGEHWWMFSNIDYSGADSHMSELSIFYSDDPLTGEWRAHRMNPVICDSELGRNGGLLARGNDIYRVCQRQGFGVYGAGFSIRRIKVLTPDDYEEELVRRVDPVFMPNLRGCHHMYSDSGITVFDFCRSERVAP